MKNNKDVKSTDVVNYIRHTWIKHVRGKLPIEFKKAEEMLKIEGDNLVGFIEQQMKDLIENATKKGGQVTNEDWAAFQSRLKDNTANVFNTIKVKVFSQTKE